MSIKNKILYLSASPNDQLKVSVDEEFRMIYEKIDDRYFKMISVSGAQASEFQSLVLKHKPQIIHFSGHASADEIYFENAGKKSESVSKNALVNFFQILDEKPLMIFLNACRTAESLEGLHQVIDFIVATRRPVFDEAAVTFAARFYEYLSLGRSLENAFNLAKNQFGIKNARAEAEVYERFIREGADGSFVFAPKSDAPDKSAKKKSKKKKPKDRFSNNINGNINGKNINIGETINQTINE